MLTLCARVCLSAVISCEDIGRIAATALLHPQDYAKKVLPLAAEDLNMEQLADAFESVRGGSRPDTTPLPPQALAGVPDDLQRMFKVRCAPPHFSILRSLLTCLCEKKTPQQFLRERGFGYDVAELKKETPGQLLSFKEWLKA